MFRIVSSIVAGLCLAAICDAEESIEIDRTDAGFSGSDAIDTVVIISDADPEELPHYTSADAVLEAYFNCDRWESRIPLTARPEVDGPLMREHYAGEYWRPCAVFIPPTDSIPWCDEGCKVVTVQVDGEPTQYVIRRKGDACFVDWQASFQRKVDELGREAVCFWRETGLDRGSVVLETGKANIQVNGLPPTVPVVDVLERSKLLRESPNIELFPPNLLPTKETAKLQRISRVIEESGYEHILPARVPLPMRRESIRDLNRVIEKTGNRHLYPWEVRIAWGINNQLNADLDLLRVEIRVLEGDIRIGDTIETLVRVRRGVPIARTTYVPIDPRVSVYDFCKLRVQVKLDFASIDYCGESIPVTSALRFDVNKMSNPRIKRLLHPLFPRSPSALFVTSTVLPFEVEPVCSPQLVWKKACLP